MNIKGNFMHGQCSRGAKFKIFELKSTADCLAQFNLLGLFEQLCSNSVSIEISLKCFLKMTTFTGLTSL